MRNMRMPRVNTTGVKGVSIDRRSGKFIARVRDHKGEPAYLGVYSSIEEATAVVVEARLRFHEEFARHG